MSLQNINRRAAGLAFAALAFESAVQIGGYQNPVVAWGLGGLTVLFVIYAFWDVELGGRFLPGSFVSLADAARRSYERSRGKTWGDVAERFSESPDEILRYFAVGLSRQIPIFGKHPPSTVREQIPASEFNSTHIDKGATTMTRSGEMTPRYVELQVRRSDLRDALSWFDSENKAFEDHFSKADEPPQAPGGGG